MTSPHTTPSPDEARSARDRANPVTDHMQEWCEHEMSSCRGGCPPYGYCSSGSHKSGEMLPDWPCGVALRALGETRAEWVAKHNADLDAYADWMQRHLSPTEQHVERPTRMLNGQTYCACGSPWPCQFSEATRV